MKATNFVLLLLVGAAITFTSCKKNEDDPSPTPSAMIANWDINSMQVKEYEDNQLVIDTTVAFNAGEYFNMYDSTHAETYIFGDHDTADIVLISDTEFRIDGETADVVTLTSSAFAFTITDESLDSASGILYKSVSQINMSK